MHKTMIPVAPIALLLASLLPAAATTAVLPTKLWVSNSGADSTACGAVVAPCRTFQQAHDNLAPGGEIGVLSPGDYGGTGTEKLTIAKSVSITNEGSGEASILAGSGNGNVGIFVNAGRGAVASLRGLVIDGQVAGDTGIFISETTAIHIQNCVVRNFEGGRGRGISMGGGGSPAQLFISDSIIFNNGSGAASGGIAIESGGNLATINVVLVRVNLENNVRGLWADSRFTMGGVHAVIRDSVISGNAADGVFAVTTAGRGGPAFIVVEHSSIVNNAGTGLRADGAGATMLLNDNTVTRNGIGIGVANSGQLISYGNNKVNNNLGPDGTPTGSYNPI